MRGKARPQMYIIPKRNLKKKFQKKKQGGEEEDKKTHATRVGGRRCSFQLCVVPSLCDYTCDSECAIQWNPAFITGFSALQTLNVSTVLWRVSGLSRYTVSIHRDIGSGNTSIDYNSQMRHLQSSSSVIRIRFSTITNNYYNDDKKIITLITIPIPISIIIITTAMIIIIIIMRLQCSRSSHYLFLSQLTAPTRDFVMCLVIEVVSGIEIRLLFFFCLLCTVVI